jgi:hypothetical protein
MTSNYLNLESQQLQQGLARISRDKTMLRSELEQASLKAISLQSEMEDFFPRKFEDITTEFLAYAINTNTQNKIKSFKQTQKCEATISSSVLITYAVQLEWSGDEKVNTPSTATLILGNKLKDLVGFNTVRVRYMYCDFESCCSLTNSGFCNSKLQNFVCK